MPKILWKLYYLYEPYLGILYFFVALSVLEVLTKTYRVLYNEGYAELGYKIVIFQSRTVIFEFLSLTTLIRFDT